MLVRTLPSRQTSACLVQQVSFATKSVTQLLLLSLLSTMENYVPRATTALRDLLKPYPVLEVLITSTKACRRLNNAACALPTVTTTIRELEDASLAVSSLSPKKALLNAAALVLSAPTLLKMLPAVAALVTFSRMRPVKS